MVIHIALDFLDCDEPFVRKSSESGYVNTPGRGQRTLAWNGDEVDFAYASGGQGPLLQSLSALRFNAPSSKNRTMHDRMMHNLYLAWC